MKIRKAVLLLACAVSWGIAVWFAGRLWAAYPLVSVRSDVPVTGRQLEALRSALLPPWITPARWSDFSYWGGLLPAVGKAIETGFSLNPCAKDVLAKWNTLGLLIAATLANAAAGKLMLSRQQKNSTNL